MHVELMFRFPRLALVAALSLTLVSLTVPGRTDAAADPKTVAKCQAALAKGGAKFVVKKLGTLAKCTDAIFACIQTVADDAKRTACIEKARGKCGGGMAAITAARQAFVAAAAKPCAGLDAAQITAASGLGYAGVTCTQFGGGAVTDLASLTACLAKQHDCLAGQIFQLEVPRVLELVNFTPPAAVTVSPTDAEALACLDDVGGSGADLNDPVLGKSVAKCQKAIDKIGAKLASQRLGGLSKCVDALFVCAATKTGADLTACNDKGKAGCTKAFTKNDAQTDAAKAATAKACGDPTVFTAFRAPAGGNLDALLPSTLTTAPRTARALDGLCSQLTTVAEYQACLTTNLLDLADDLVTFEIPRSENLLSDVGCTVDACGGGANPTPTPTATPPGNAAVITRILSSAGDGTHALTVARAIAADTNGNAYVVGTLSSNAFKVTQAGIITQIIGPTGDGAGHTLQYPNGVAVGTNETVYVSGVGSDNVFKITSNGTITQILDSTGDGTHSLFDPTQIAVASDDTVYVVGGSSKNLFKIAPGGTITQILDSTGGGFGYDEPEGIAVDAAKNVYAVADASSNVLKITDTGTVSRILSSSGDGVHSFDHPMSVAVHGTDVFVAGGYDNKAAVYKITSTGTVSRIFDPTGDGQGHAVTTPASVATDAAGNVYVTDADSSTTFRITPDGDKSVILDPAVGDGQGHGPYLGLVPRSIAVDDQDRIYVTSLNNNNVFKIVLP